MPRWTISTLLAFSLISSAPSFPNDDLKKIEMVSTTPMGVYVGELQEKWQFPSDHLPIGMTFEQLHILSWNVLDAEYMSWVLEKNSQGLSRSMIGKEHVYIGNSKLTIRDQHVVGLILEAISHPTAPRSLLALQECSSPFLEELRKNIPAHFEIVSCHGEALLIDTSLFDIISTHKVSHIFSDEPKRCVQDVTLVRLDNQEWLRIVNVHLPGDPLKPGRFEFAKYLAKTFDPTLTTIAMGDMNFNEIEIGEAVNEAFDNVPFSLYSPYCTNISPYLFYSKAIDHFLIYSPEASYPHLSYPDEIMTCLIDIVDLLHTPVHN